MSDQNDTEIPLAEPLRRTMTIDEIEGPGYPPPAVVQPVVVQMTSREFTAKKVAVQRNLKKVIADLNTLCAQWGETYVWSWEVWDNRLQRKVPIEGPTIKLANDLVGLWGNCSIECEVNETPTHWIFKAWFMDAERGTAVSRLFQQRKGQNVGNKMDADRATDMVFQIGQSKAIRNVVVNALPSLSAHALEECKKRILDIFSDPKNRDKAIAFIDRVMNEHSISVNRVEATVGRTRKDWTVRDLAKVYTEMRGIFEGMSVASEVYPNEQAANDIKAKAEADAKARGAAPAPAQAGAGTGAKPADLDPKPAQGGAPAPTPAAEPAKPAEPKPDPAPAPKGPASIDSMSF